MAQYADEYESHHYSGHGKMTFDGKRMRAKAVNRKTVDFNSPVVNHLQV